MLFNKDILGALFSSLCLIHCLLLPTLLLVGLGSVSFAMLENEWVHYGLFAPILTFVVWSIPSGFKIHHNKLPPIFAAIGLIFFVAGMEAPENIEIYFTVAASSLIIFAHLYNRHLLNSASCLTYIEAKTQ